MLAEVAEDVSQAATVAAEGAKNVEDTLRPKASEKAKLESEPAEIVGIPSTEEFREGQKDTSQKAKALAAQVKEDARGAWLRAKNEGDPDRIKEEMINRITKMVHQTQSNPEYQRSIFTLLSIVQTYADKALETMDTATTAAKIGAEATISSSRAKVEADRDPNTDMAINDAKTLLGRVSSKPSLINSIGTRLRGLAQQLSKDLAPPETAGDDQLNDIQKWARSFQDWGSRALRDPSYVTTDEFNQELGQLYDGFVKILNAEGPEEKKLQADLREVLQEVQEFVDSVTSNKSVRRLLASITKLTLDTAYITSVSSLDIVGVAQLETQRIAKQAREEIRRDILGFVIPRLMQAMQVLPLPRMEYASPEVDVVLDNLNLHSPSFLPDHFRVTNWSHLDFVGPDVARKRGSYSATQKSITSSTTIPSIAIAQAHTRTRIHIDGLRISATDVAYYINYKGPLCLGWKDWGLLSIDVGREGKVGEGLKLDIELEMVDQDLDIKAASREVPAPSTPGAPDSTPVVNGQAPKPSFFKVVTVKVDTPGLTFQIRKSRHWIFNSLCLQPLLGPTVREAVHLVVQQQMRAGLEGVDQKLARASESAKHRTGQEPSLFDYLYELVYGHITTDKEDEDEERREENGIPAAQKTSEIGVTGVVIRSHQPATTADEDTLLAVGIGEQVLRDVPLPDPSDAPNRARNVEDTGPRLANEGRQAVNDLEHAAETVADETVEVMEEVEDVRERAKGELAHARVRLKDRKKWEGRQKGWKSPAFNF